MTSSAIPADQINVFRENAYLVVEHRDTGLVGRSPAHLSDALARATENLMAILDRTVTA